MSQNVPASRDAANRHVSDASDEPAHYTGVLIVHGVGDEKRNETLEEASNALVYWFENQARLEQRPTGPGRVWVDTKLTFDNNADAQASRAIIELEAPAPDGDAGDTSTPLRLQLREVWWAQSFGPPPVRLALQWARVQFREEGAGILLPFFLHLRKQRQKRAGVGSHMRAHEGALPAANERNPDETIAGPDCESSSAAPLYGQTKLGRSARWTLRAGVLAIDVIQSLVKSIQWILVAPLISILLILMGIVRLLAIIPFLSNAILTGLAALTARIALHWIAPLQTYLLDYTRAPGIRQIFERELDDLLADPCCDRVVVVAHSMGCVIAYDGLARLSVATRQGNQQLSKAITFISLGQALRRMWHIAARVDPKRPLGELPSAVRWVNLWARFDPVAAGPLDAAALPDTNAHASRALAYSKEALLSTLERVENVEVANADSIFSDHLTYWANLEQVVGRIAEELVVGHPGLEGVARRARATLDAVLLRRWGIAWRAAVALAAGSAVGAGLAVYEIQHNLALGKSVVAVLISRPFIAVVGGLLNLLFPGLGTAVQGVLPAAPPYLEYVIPQGAVDALATAGVVLAAAGICFAVFQRAIVKPSPVSARLAGQIDRATWLVFALLVSSIGLGLAVDLATHFAQGGISYLYNSSFIIALLAVAAWVFAILDAFENRRWAWLAIVVLFPSLAIVTLLPYYVPALQPQFSSLLRAANSDAFGTIMFDLLVVGSGAAVFGSIAMLIDAVRGHQWGLSAALLLASIGATFFALVFSGFVNFNSMAVGVGIVAVGLYGLRSGPAHYATLGRKIAVRWVFALSLANAPFLLIEDPILCGYSGVEYGTCLFTQGVTWPTLVGSGMAFVALSVALVDAARMKRWVWLAALPAVALAAFAVWAGTVSTIYSPLRDTSIVYILATALPSGNYETLIHHGIWLGAIATGITYGLWGGPPSTRRKVSVPALVVGIAGAVATGAALVALTATLIPQMSPPKYKAISGEAFAISSAQFGGITTGQDGNLWFTEDDIHNTEVSPSSPKGISHFGRIGRITPNGEITRFDLANKMGRIPLRITATSDGSLWVTEVFDLSGQVDPGWSNSGNSLDFFTNLAQGTTGAISHIASDGQPIAEYPLQRCGQPTVAPSASIVPVDITAGPDGNVWFTTIETEYDKTTGAPPIQWGHVGRITPSGTCSFLYTTARDMSCASKVPYGPLGDVPTGITAGQDSTIWFTQAHINDSTSICGSSKIVNLSLDGHTLSDYVLPAGSVPAHIAMGHDGTVWFTEIVTSGQDQTSGQGVIGRLTPTGLHDPRFDLRTKTVSRRCLGPDDITVDPSGSAWFSEPYSPSLNTASKCFTISRVGRITPSNDFTEFAPLGGFSPWGVTTRPDGSIWITDNSIGSIWRLTP